MQNFGTDTKFVWKGPNWASLQIWCLSLFFILSLPALAEQEFFPFLGEINTDRVNIRAGGSTNFENIAQLHQGDEVVVVEHSYSWYKIKMPYLAKSFVSAEFVQKTGETRGQIMVNRLNVRAAPHVNSTSLGQLTLGAEVSILSEKDGWYQIEPLPESFGWVADEFIAFKSMDVSGWESREAVKRTARRELVLQEVQSLPESAAMEKDVLQKESEEVISGPKKLTVQGILKKRTPPGTIEPLYQLFVNGKPAYSLQGIRQLMDPFVHYTVEIEGAVQPKEDSDPYPVIVISRLQLIL